MTESTPDLPEIGIDEIDELKAGRELDALIARWVMGWSAADMRLLGDLRDLPHYSTDPAAAWVVVEKLRLTLFPIAGSGQWLAISDYPFRGEDEYWISNERIAMRGAYADTAPLSICRAALKAFSYHLSGGD